MIFGFLSQNLKTKAVAVAASIAWHDGDVEQEPADGLGLGRLAAFRRRLHGCFTARADALFELCDAVLCRTGRVHMLAERRQTGGPLT
jgi:hypothetical protein